MRLRLGGSSEADIREGIKRLGGVLRRTVQRQNRARHWAGGGAERIVSRLTWRPRHFAPAKNMTVQVRHRFAGIATVVEHQPIARLLQAQLRGDFRRFEQQVANGLFISR